MSIIIASNTIVVILGFTCSILPKSIGHGAEFVNPPSGSLIANFEGAKNVSTLTCNVLNSANLRSTTAWFAQNFKSQSDLVLINSNNGLDFSDLFSFGGDPVPTDSTKTYLNKLTFVNFTSELDGVTVFCGTAVDREQANFFLRVYSKFAIRTQCPLHVTQFSMLSSSKQHI